jgi:hypothetical protein
MEPYIYVSSRPWAYETYRHAVSQVSRTCLAKHAMNELLCSCYTHHHFLS